MNADLPTPPQDVEFLLAARRRKILLATLRRLHPLPSTDQSSALLMSYRTRDGEAFQRDHPGPFLLGHIRAELPPAMSIAGGTHLPLRTQDASFLIEIPLANEGHDNFTIGRSIPCDLVLDFFQISQLHVYLGRIGENWFLADADSSNGTFVNGERLIPDRQSPLKENMRINLGTSIEIFFLEAKTLVTALESLDQLPDRLP